MVQALTSQSMRLSVLVLFHNSWDVLTDHQGHPGDML